MRKLIIATVATSALIASGAMAQGLDNVYVNAGVTQRHTDASDTASVTGRVGYVINKNFAVEAEGGFGINEDTVLGVEVKEKGNLGAYAVGILPVSEKFTLLGRMGYAHTWAEAKAFGIKAEDDDGSFAAGVGAEYSFDGKNGIRMDYTRLTKNDGVDLFSIAYSRKF